MTIDEKLQHFYDASVEEARDDASREIEEHKKTLSDMLEKHKQTALAQAEAEIKAETENAKREVNKALSTQQITMKRNWTKKQNELKDSLFAEVKQHLEAFMLAPEYEDYLCKKIQEARDFAGEDELQIYLSSEETDRVQALSQRTGFPIQVSKENFMGGIKAAIPTKNILIDNSFLGNFQALYKEFTFDGGPHHA